MTTDELDMKIARWLGWKEIWQGNTELLGLPPDCATDNIVPDFQHSDSEAIKLLPVLMEKGYYPELYRGTDEGIDSWYFQVNPELPYSVKSTISEAICAAVLQVIDKEEGNDLHPY